MLTWNRLPINFSSVKVSFAPSLFSALVSLRCGHRGLPGPQRSDAGRHRIESGSTALNRRSPGRGPGGSIFLTTGTHRAAKQRRLIPGHHRSSFGMTCISTLRPRGETVANRHELCLRWRYGDSRLGHGVLRRTAGVAPTLAGRTTVWHGKQPVNASKVTVELRYDYSTTRWRRLNYRNSI